MYLLNEETVESKTVNREPRYNDVVGETATEEPVAVEVENGPPEVDSSSANIRGISINPLSSGYMVKVGCQSVAVEKTETLIDMLNKYLTNPRDFEKKWFSKENRNRLENI